MRGQDDDASELDPLDAQTELTIAKKSSSDALLSNRLQLAFIGNGTFVTHSLPDEGEVSIGRSRENTVCIDDKSISRRQAILRTGATLTIEDVGSANGTLVKERKIEPGCPTPIAIGELITLGSLNAIVQQRTSPFQARRMWTHEYLEARLEEECARARRSNTSFALLRIQTDRAVPSALVQETLAECLRESDIVGAYAPNQHEILLVDVADGSTAEEVKRRITRSLGERGVRPRVFSAFYPRDGRTAYALTATLSAQATAPTAPNAAAEIVVADSLMRSLYLLVDQIAASSIGVLLLGETGVGKEVFARAIHTASPRAKNAFVDINCAALSESLLESELFGHEKGAFTSAVGAKTGLLESAQGGTVLLDEVGDMPLVTQAKLLRVIEDRSVRRVGGVKARPLDIRFVAATNRDLQADVARGTFRRDLYFRLNGVTIVIPPLRERVAEIEPLARALAAAAAAQASRPVPEIADDALALLRAYPWPGNVRELRNVIERAILVCGEGEIRAEHLPAGTMSTMFMSRRDTPIPDDEPVDEQWLPPRPRTKGPEERQWIVDALERANGNQTKTARMLGISRRTLITRLEEYGLHRPRKRT